MSRTDEFRELLTAYDGTVRELIRKKRPFEGLLGFGRRAADEPCHEELDARIEALCKAAGEEEDAAGLAELTEAVLKAERRWEGPEYARLMLAAAQRHTLELIPRLDPADRSRLADWYAREYPRRKRLPVQDKILDTLKGKA